MYRNLYGFLYHFLNCMKFYSKYFFFLFGPIKKRMKERQELIELWYISPSNVLAIFKRGRGRGKDKNRMLKCMQKKKNHEKRSTQEQYISKLMYVLLIDLCWRSRQQKLDIINWAGFAGWKKKIWVMKSTDK